MSELPLKFPALPAAAPERLTQRAPARSKTEANRTNSLIALARAIRAATLRIPAPLRTSRHVLCRRSPTYDRATKTHCRFKDDGERRRALIPNLMPV